MKRWWILVLGLSLIAAACGDDGTRPGVTDAPDTTQPGATSTTAVDAPELAAADALAAARNRWASAPTDYTVDVDDGGTTQTLAVRDGEVVSLSGELLTVEDVFATIDDALAADATVEVEYHATLGYPTRLRIDRDGDGEFDVDLTLDDLEAMPIVTSLEELLAARELWDAQELDNYRFIARAECTCPEGGTYEVTVSDGIATNVPLDERARNSDVEFGDLEDAFRDLEAWFRDATEFIEEGLLDVDVRMDPELGYPRWFRIEGEGLPDPDFRDPFTFIITLDLVDAPDGVPPPSRPDDQDIEELNAAWERWDQARLQDYAYTYTRICECDETVRGPFRVEVEAHRIRSVTRLSDGSVASEDDIRDIESALQVVGVFINTDRDVDVQYDDLLGYPTLAVLDTDAVAVDGGLMFEISDFSALPDKMIVIGVVTSGPHCPVQQDPPAEECEDQPVPNAMVLAGFAEDGAASIPLELKPSGVFIIWGRPGEYVIEAAPLEGFLGTPEPVVVSAGPGELVRIELQYDTGIR